MLKFPEQVYVSICMVVKVDHILPGRAFKASKTLIVNLLHVDVDFQSTVQKCTFPRETF